MRPPKLELPPSKCDTSMHFLLMSCHTLSVNKKQQYKGVYEQVITVYIYRMEILKYTQKRLILTTVIKNILIIHHAVDMLRILAVPVFQNKKANPTLILKRTWFHTRHLNESLP